MRGALGVTSLAPDVSPGQAVGVESVLTFILLLTIFAASDSSRKLLGYEVALAIGVAVFICHSAGVSCEWDQIWHDKFLYFSTLSLPWP